MKNKNVGLENLKGFRIGADSEVKDLIPSGHAELDHAISADIVREHTKFKLGGFPLGKVILFYGNEGGGKSSLAYRVVGSAQRMGYNCAWIDTEHSFSDQLAKVNGVDKDRLYYNNLINEDNPDEISTAENIMDTMMAACSSSKINVIVLDSIANLVPSRVMENGADKETVAELARVLSRTMGKLLSYAARHNVLVILINQLREKVGVMFGSPDTMPGGKSLKHACSCILKITKLESQANLIRIQEDNGTERVIGKYSSVIIEKNRFAKPHIGSIKVPMYYEPYFPNVEDVCFNVGRDLKIIKIRNNVFSWNSIKEEGRSSFVEKIKSPETINDLILAIKDESEKQNISLPVEIINFDIAEYKKNMKKFVTKKVETTISQTKDVASPKASNVDTFDLEEQEDEQSVSD